MSKENRIIEKTDLVSDDILNQIISNKLISEECRNGYILDGYPRTIPQSEFILSFTKSKKF